MFDLQQFLIKLDEAYSGDPKNIEPLLQEGLIQARGAGDKASILVLLNELMGYYRVMSDAAGIEDLRVPSSEALSGSESLKKSAPPSSEDFRPS